MATKNNNATTNVATENNNEVMNQTIVRLNEMKAVKMASLSKGKRPTAKFNKEVATYLLDNWDNLEQLKICVNAMHKDMPEGCEEVMQMYDTRISELEPKKEVKPIKLSDGERSVLRIFFNSIESENGFHMEDVQQEAEKYGYGKRSIAGYSKTLSDKHLLDMYSGMDCYFDGELTAKGMEIAQTITDGEIVSKTAENKETTKAQTKSEGGEKSRRGRKSTHYVGEVHPVNPNWTWMEYLPGKFGWKSIRGKQGREQFPDRVPVEFKMNKKESAGKAENTTKQADKKSDKAAKKSDKKAAGVQEKQLTLEELLAKPIPQGLSKPQQNVIKAFKKGYKIRKDGQSYWLTDKDGNNERTEKGVLEALQRRYKINYIPKGAMLADK